jgi:hypothetical protein
LEVPVPLSRRLPAELCWHAKYVGLLRRLITGCELTTARSRNILSRSKNNYF